MIPLLIGIFLVILFIVTIVLSVSTWRGWHIAAACLTFLAAIGLVVVASMSVRTHTTWRKRHAELEKQLTDAHRDGIVLERGDPAMVVSPTPSLNDVQQRLNRMLLDRGRVWRQCTPNPPAANGFLVSTVPPRDDGQPGDPNTAKPNGIVDKMVLYAFRESPEQYPIAFLGEFQVVEAQATSVTLQPTMLLDVEQTELVKNLAVRWSLYEMMPLDAHRLFADEDTVGQSLDDTNKPIFGEMNEQDLRAMFSIVTRGAPIDSPLVSDLVASYVKDGSPADEQDVNQSPDNIWRKLEFEKAHKERVDSNNLDPGLTGNYFDPEGYAEVTRLRSGGEASFRENDIGLFPYCYDIDKSFVDGLISRGICRNMGPFYVRTLRDYEESYHNIQDRLFRRLEDMRRAQRDIDALNDAIRKTQGQIAYRQDERAKLRTDLDGFNRDKEKTAQLAATLESQKTALRDELSDLYQTNLALSQQLAEYNAKLTEEINRRAADVAVQLQ